MKKIIKILLPVFLIFLFASCQEDRLIIAISKASGSEHYKTYPKWVNEYAPEAEIIDMYGISRDSAFALMEICDGLILSGGPDVDPNEYGKPHEADRCSIDQERDTLEFGLVVQALKNKVPILAICRGEQLLNVSLGGSLIVDIPSDHPNAVIHQTSDPDDPMHKIEIVENTFLHRLCGVNYAEVNTNHHQAVDSLAEPFRASAFTADGIIEAFEWKNPDDKPFMIAVQWHPERLPRNHPMSEPIILKFVESVKLYDKERKNLAEK